MSAFTGRWRIVATDDQNSDDLDLVEPAYVEFTDDNRGSFVVIAIHGQLDTRETQRSGRPLIEFTWEGDQEGDPASGRGWATLHPDGTLEGVLFLHLADDLPFRAVRRTPTTHQPR